MTSLYQFKFILWVFTALLFFNVSAAHAAELIRDGGMYKDDDTQYGLLEEGYEARLILQEHDFYDNRQYRVGMAEYKDFGNDMSGHENKRLLIEVTSQKIVITGPFTVYINDIKIGKTSSTHINKLGVDYIFHELNLDTKNGDKVPLVLESDVIQLINGDLVIIIGEFVSNEHVPQD